jgi:hypothetical protein
MPLSNALAFTSNPNKDYLRSIYDRQLVREWFQRKGQPLHYLGLPGPEILDVVEWQEFIDRFSTIERLENEPHLLFLRANVSDLEHRLHSLYGEFDEILLTGRDKYGHTPRWPYDLVNLDFFGGLLYNDLNRPKALEKLITNQKSYETSFLLIVTYHLRDADLSGEKVSFVEDLHRKMVRDFGTRTDIEQLATWYRAKTTPDAARQGLYLNTFLHDMGEASSFKVLARQPVVYTGSGGARMIHFATDFYFQKGAHRPTSDQSLVDVINLGYVELKAAQVAEPVQIPRITHPSANSS